MASDDLTKMIDSLVEQKTFGLDAIEGVRALREKALDLEKKLAAANVAAVGASDTNSKQSALLQKNESTIAEWQKREADLRAREAKMTELEKSVAVKTAEASVWDQCFGRIFANRMVREQVASNIPTTHCPPGTTYPITNWNTETKTVAREEG